MPRPPLFPETEICPRCTAEALAIVQPMQEVYKVTQIKEGKFTAIFARVEGTQPVKMVCLACDYSFRLPEDYELIGG